MVVFAAVLAMISNLSVNEPDNRRRRVTTALMVLPAAASTVVGTLLAEHRLVSDVLFVLVMMTAVWIRRYGPRGTALGMAMFIPYFFTQFLQARPAQLPALLAAVGVGIGSTLLLRGGVFAEKPEKVLDDLLRAVRAHVHALALAVIDVLEAPAGDEKAIDAALRDLHRRRTRLNDTMLLVVDRIEQLRDERGEPDEEAGEDDPRRALSLAVADLELAAERLAVSTRRLADDPARPGALEPEVREALLGGVRGIASATATGAPEPLRAAVLDAARRSVEELAAEHSGARPREQRVAFAIVRLADALTSGEGGEPAVPAPVTLAEPPEDEGEEDDESGRPVDRIALSTRQAIQVGVATSLAIVVGELISPARWYWAVIATFVVFAGTVSRGEVLARGWQRLVGTVGGVVAGMLLAVLVGGRPVPTLILLAACVFLALYLFRISVGLLAFWITAVLALLYGLIGQFSVETLVLRVIETAVGGALGALAALVVLPKHTRAAFQEALDDTVLALDETLGATVDRMTGRPPTGLPVVLARTADEKLGTLRQRAEPLDNPLPRRHGRGSYQRALRVLTAVDHYARALARLSDRIVVPGWAPTLDPAVARVRANVAGLGELLGPGGAAGSQEIVSAEELVDAAEAWAARCDDPGLRRDLLSAVLPLRRIDQVVVGFAGDLAGGPAPAQEPAESRG
ncbi:FUSC family protein [Pseudonocardia yuanmonensis]|uniref:FUSC family protein n=1 Tax=Pseudonocardia yuanmonensis TaxID=1095914 RepID=A0ABP8W3D9_9PSEU